MGIFGKAPAKRVLLIGCGSSRERRIRLPGDPADARDWGGELTTLDAYDGHKPDIVHDLEQMPWPFADNTFDRIDAYEVLEHLGRQGDARSFFAHFYECWRILKPGGYLAATCPSYKSVWAFGDPSHTRVISSGSITFLDQEQYAKQVGKTAMSDFRWLWKGDFKAVVADMAGEAAGTGFLFVLQAMKPARRFPLTG